MRRDKDRTKEQPVNELALLRQRITELETLESERKQTEKMPSVAEDYYRMFELFPIGVTVLDVKGMILYCNSALYIIGGYSEDDLVGKHFSKISSVRLEDIPKFVKVFASLVRRKIPKPFEVTYQQKGGTTGWTELHISLKRIGGKRRILVLQHDITERKQAEEELRKHREHLEELVKERTLELEQANIHLQEVDRLKSVFMASMSHELRTPLNSIIGFTSIILQGMSGEVNEEQRRQLTMVKNSASHLLSLIENILDISKIEAGTVELSPEEFSLDDLVREVMETLSPVASEKGLEFLTEVPEGITLFSDKRRVKQVLTNLVSNAVKFTDQGSVTIAARVPGDENLEIRVIDMGIGIKEEDMYKLFQPFQQIGVSFTKKHGGAGLGLHLSKKLTDFLGGDISAESEYGRGSQFVFTIPLRL